MIGHDSAGQPYQVVRFNEDGSKALLDLAGHVTRTLPKGERLATSKKDRARLVPSTPKRVALVRRIFQLYLGGMGFKTIAARLNREGVPSPRNGGWAGIHDGHWPMSTVRSIVLNPLYAGDMVWNRRTAGKFHRISQGRAAPRPAIAAGKMGANEEEDWIIVRNTHTPLVDREMFERARALRQIRDRKGAGNGFGRGRGKNSPFLLSGLIRCEACGHAFQGYTTTKAKARKSGEKVKTLYYACGGYITKGNSVCPRVLFRQEALDQYVLEAIGERVTRFLDNGGTALLRELVVKLLDTGPEDPRPEIARLRARVKEIEAKADQLLEMMSPSNQDFVEQKLAKLRREREGTQARLQDLESVNYQPPDLDGAVDAILDELRDFPRVVAEGTIEERKAFVRAFIPGITLHPHEARGVVRIRRFPLPPSGDSGNSSFGLVAGARFEVEKKNSDDAAAVDELLRLVFQGEGATLVPA